MSIEDIRRLEKEAQEKLREKYHKNSLTVSPGGSNEDSTNEDPPKYEDIQNVNETLNHTESQLPSGRVFH